jgi:hypothetical protein
VTICRFPGLGVLMPTGPESARWSTVNLLPATATATAGRALDGVAQMSGGRVDVPWR